MIPAGSERKPFLHYLLVNAAEAGFRRVILTIAPGDSTIREFFEEAFMGMALKYVEQITPEGREKPAGTADALLQVIIAEKSLLGKTFCVCNSDNLYSVKTLDLVRNACSESAMPCYNSNGFRYPEDRTSRFAVVKFSADRKIEGILEKPSVEEIDSIDSSFISMNLFKLETSRILPFLKIVQSGKRGEKELPSAVNLMIEEFTDCMQAIEVSEHVPDLTSASDIALILP